MISINTTVFNLRLALNYARIQTGFFSVEIIVKKVIGTTKLLQIATKIDFSRC